MAEHFNWLFSVLWSSLHPPPNLQGCPLVSSSFSPQWLVSELPGHLRMVGCPELRSLWSADLHYLCTFLLGCLAKCLKLQPKSLSSHPTGSSVLRAACSPLAFLSRPSGHPFFPLFMCEQFSSPPHFPPQVCMLPLFSGALRSLTAVSELLTPGP